MRVIVAADGPPGRPRDPQDHPGDPEANQRIGDGHPDRDGAASPKLWIRSARRAMLPVATKIAS